MSVSVWLGLLQLQSKEGSAVSRGALMLEVRLRFRCYCPQVTDAPEWSHGVTGTTGPLLLMASMQFFRCSCTVRVGLPATVFPSMAS